ncbi:MAG: ABC transporter substrate-binding protein [Micrococcales bacterium]|nr:ABC transporter substrate-binding protein [Micrococcales bacterium]
MAISNKAKASLALVTVACLALSACGGSKRDEGTADSGGGGGDRAANAKQILADAGVATPVDIKLQYNTDHYGGASDREYGMIKKQLEDSGLFKVDLQSNEWVTYNEQRITDYPVYQLGWFPDYPDPDNYLTPFFERENFLGNGFVDEKVIDLLAQQRVEQDEATRADLIVQLQDQLAIEMPTIPLLQGAQQAVVGTDVTGVQETLDASFQFRYSTFQKGGDPAAKVTIGTTDQVTNLDPAGSYDNGSYLVQLNVYPFVIGFPQQDPRPTPDLAESCDFSDDGAAYTCKIKPGLKWANGHTLDAEDVKFSYDRQMAIADPNGPSSLLVNLDSVETPDPLTVVFKLVEANDVTFPQILASPVGPIVDNEVFDANALTPAATIVDAQAFYGPYSIATYKENDLVDYAPNADYVGVQGKAQNGGITMKYYKKSENMRVEVDNGTIDVAWRMLTATDIATLSESDKVNVLDGPGGEIRYIVFNFDIMPGDNDDQKRAVRQAMASVIDRQQLSTEVYQDTYTPLCSFVPEGQLGASTAVCDKWGK